MGLFGSKEEQLLKVFDVEDESGIVHVTFADVRTVGPPDQKEDLIVAIIIPSLDGKVHYSLLHLWSIVSLQVKYVILCQSEETYLSLARNKAIDQANEVSVKGLNRLPDYYFFLDEDSVVHPNVFRALKDKLEKHKIDIISASYIRKRRHIPVFTPVEFFTKWHGKHKWKVGDLVEVLTTGGGCLLVKGAVMRKIPPPWFKVITEVGGKQVMFGEDAYFCQKAREYGYKTYVATDIPIGHQGSIVFPGDFEARNRKPREASKMWDPFGDIRGKK